MSFRILFIAIAMLIYMAPTANAATCVSGEYLNSDVCTSCESGYYCTGDDTRTACPNAQTHARTTFPAEYHNPKIVSTYLNMTTGAYRLTQCRALTWLDNQYGRMYEYADYNETTEKYDLSTVFAWAAVNAGYYLTDKYNSAGATYLYYATLKSCVAGGYCPGKEWVRGTPENRVPDYLPDFGLEVCGDNSYSDAGASSCTPCPAGTGNSGSNLSDHAGVSSCKTISCPAGQEVVNYVCTACKAGYYKASAGSASCTQCTDYKYASGTGNTSCILPPAGYNSTGCSSGKGCTGQEPCGTSWYCPGDGRYYSCPSNSTARTNTSTSADDCLCNSGYVKRSGECKQLCTAGFTTLNSNGVSVNAYADKLTTPAINISANGKTCYVPLASGSASGAINVSYDSKTYHTVN